MKNVRTINVNGKEINIEKIDAVDYIAIKPICNAIGVNYTTQIEKIDEDEKLHQLTPLGGMVAEDGKTRKMRAIPYRYVFGWLFTISPKNVSGEVRKRIMRYRDECYDALFDHFTKRNTIIKEKVTYQKKIGELKEELKKNPIQQEIKILESKVKNASERLNNLDKNIVNEQMDLFNKQPSTNN